MGNCCGKGEEATAPGAFSGTVRSNSLSVKFMLLRATTGHIHSYVPN